MGCSDEKCGTNEAGCNCGSSCACGQQNCNCGSGCGSHGQEYDKFAMMMYLAKEAKMELLKDKIKKKLESEQGKKYDEIAAVLVEALMQKKKDKMEAEKHMEEMRERFYSILEK